MTKGPARLRGLSRPMLLISLVMLAVSAMLIGLTFYTGNLMDRDSARAQSEMVDNAFTSKIRSGLGELQSVAWWDDTVVYTAPKTFDQGWLDENIGSYMIETYKHNRLYVLDERNKPIYDYGFDDASKENGIKADLRAAAPIIAQARGGPDRSPRVLSTAKPGELYERGEFGNRKYSRGFGAIVDVQGRPAIVVALLITPSFDTSVKSPARRLAVSVQEIGNSMLADFGRDMLIKDLAFSQRATPGRAAYLLRTDRGKPLTEIVWTPKRPGTEMIQRVLPFIVAALLIAGILMAYLLYRLSRSTAALANREEHARFLADHDALTGLPNRRMVETLYDALVKDHGGTPPQRFLIACVDLDRFKDINDTLGHHAGDELIKAVAERLKSRLDSDDTLARIGGDEFAIMRAMPWMSDLDGVSNIVAECFLEPFEVQGHQIESNASVGIAFADGHDSFDQSIKRADIALYDAKANGRGRSSRFTVAMSQSLEKRHAIETDLKLALAAGELELYYQPLVEAQTGVISSLEALLRWTSPTHGSVPPDIFVPVAEEAGMMAELGRFVIDRAFADARRWPELATAINISPAQLRSASIVSDLLSASTRYKVPASQITLEITETVLMSNDERTLRVLNQLKQEGFGLSLDDFGTGYSSLAYLRDFPFDKLKIDRSFVKGLRVNDRALAIVEGVVNFGRILGREIVAEGIETEQEMQAMQAAGCTHLQGWLFSKALPAGHIEALTATFGRLSARRDFATADTAQVSAADVAAPSRRNASLSKGRRRA